MWLAVSVKRMVLQVETAFFTNLICRFKEEIWETLPVGLFAEFGRENFGNRGFYYIVN